MNKLWLLLLRVISYPSIHAQEVKHTPTVQQCRADQKLWASKLEQTRVTTGTNGTADVSFKEFIGWMDEMMDCGNVDPESYVKYDGTKSETYAAMLSRLVPFLTCHNLMNQFLAEDAQGQYS